MIPSFYQGSLSRDCGIAARIGGVFVATGVLALIVISIVVGWKSRASKHAEYANLPFEYGTNAALQFEQTLTNEGAYQLYLLLHGEGIPRTEKGFLPNMLQTRLHVLILTNGQPAINQDLTKLYMIYVGNDEIAYELAAFSVREMAVIRCQVQDLTDGRVRTSGSLKLEKFHK